MCFFFRSSIALDLFHLGLVHLRFKSLVVHALLTDLAVSSSDLFSNVS